MSTPAKYEGHTPGPWSIEANKKSFTVGTPKDKLGSYMFAEIVAKGIQTQANARLIADAPALLADNERLREALADLVKSLREYMPAIAEPAPTASGLKAHYMLAEAALAPATPTQETKP